MTSLFSPNSFKTNQLIKEGLFHKIKYLLFVCFVLILILSMVLIHISKEPSSGSFKSSNEEDGIYGWPSKIMDATSIFPWEDANLPLIAIIDSGVFTKNPYLPSNNIHNLILDKSKTYSERKHGTMVAGLIVAQGNGISTPGGILKNAKLLSLQAGDDRGMSIDELSSAIRLAVDKGAKIINISMGSDISSPELELAVQYAFSKGVVIVAAAGNEGRAHDDYPAAINEVIAVSSLNEDEKLDCNTNFDSNHNIAAPGEFLLTTGASSSDTKQWISGSSAATPLVTSLCAIILSRHPIWDQNKIRSVLFASSRKVNIDGKIVSVLDVKKSLLMSGLLPYS